MFGLSNDTEEFVLEKLDDEEYPFLDKGDLASFGDGFAAFVLGVLGEPDNAVKPSEDGYVVLNSVNNIYPTAVFVYGGELSYDNLLIVQIVNGVLTCGQGDKWLFDTSIDIIDLIDEYYDENGEV